MRKISREFISEEQRNFKFQLGRVVASSLAGFVAGVIFASLVWGVALYYLLFVILNLLQQSR